MRHLTMEAARELLEFALSGPPWDQTVAVNDMREMIVGLARSKSPVTAAASNGQRVKVGERPAYVKIGVEDEIIMALKGPPEKSPFVFLLVAVPTQAIDGLNQAKARAESRIILPR